MYSMDRIVHFVHVQSRTTIAHFKGPSKDFKGVLIWGCFCGPGLEAELEDGGSGRLDLCLRQPCP